MVASMFLLYKLLQEFGAAPSVSGRGDTYAGRYSTGCEPLALGFTDS